MAATESGIPVPVNYIPYGIAFPAATVAELISWVTGKTPRLSRYSVGLIGRQYHYKSGKIKEGLDFSPTRDLLTGMRKCIQGYIAVHD